MDEIIIIDFETTSLVQAMGTDESLQVQATELCCLKLNKSGKEKELWHSLFKPTVPLPEHITKITGLTDADLRKQPRFVEKFNSLAKFFTGAATLVAHNAVFDKGVLAAELARIDKVMSFPWPRNTYCTVEQSMHIKGHRLKLSELYQLATGRPEITGHHRATNDVRALAECYLWLKSKEGK